jgi:hypothetical protein
MPHLIGCFVLIAIAMAIVKVVIYVLEQLWLATLWLAPRAAAALAVVSALRALWHIAVACRDVGWRRMGVVEALDLQEPAYPSYVFGQARRDVALVSSRARAAMASGSAGNEAGPLALTTALVGVPVVAALAGVMWLLVALARATASTTAFGLRLGERLLRWWLAIRWICPHPGCHQAVPTPAHRCPGCGATHRALLPGRLGVWRRRCRCGTCLPTSWFNGRLELQSLCPHCMQSLPTSRVRALHVAIVGGPAVGKTALLQASLAWLRRAARKRAIGLTFADRVQRRRVFEAARAIRHGTPFTRTGNAAGETVHLTLAPPVGEAVHLHIHDPASSTYVHMDGVRSRGFHAHVDGILFLVDARSLEVVARALPPSPGSAAANIHEPAQAVYDRLAVELEGHGRLRATPLVVVLTGCEALPPAMRPPAQEAPGQHEGSAVRTWLTRHGADNLVRGIEAQVGAVCYLAVGGLRAGRSRGLVRPHAALRWLLAQHGVTVSHT